MVGWKNGGWGWRNLGAGSEIKGQSDRLPGAQTPGGPHAPCGERRPPWAQQGHGASAAECSSPARPQLPFRLLLTVSVARTRAATALLPSPSGSHAHVPLHSNRTSLGNFPFYSPHPTSGLCICLLAVSLELCHTS